jgi:hypothetical protein
MMVEPFLHATLLPAAVGILASLLIEAACRPRPKGVWRRPWSSIGMHLGFWLLCFEIGLALSRRPWFAAATVDALLLVLVLVNNAKYASLREPFVFQDYEYFTDAIKHPRLYIPFLGWWRLLLAVAAIVGAVWLGLSLEMPMTARISAGYFLLLLGCWAVGTLGLLLAAGHWLPRTDYDPWADLDRLGLLAFWWRYGADERQALPTFAAHRTFSGNAACATEARPTLVAIQSESFFDPRQLFPGIRSDVLRHFDALKTVCSAHGALQVPAWGANTVRTEFAFLSGLDPASIGVHRFNPYRSLAQSGVPTIASYLRGLGYRTVCLHPYPISFYRRDQVYPVLGFDEFIDIRGFNGAARSGPFVGDVAVAEKICDLITRSGPAQPLFAFAITMENHGPLHLETVAAGDTARYYVDAPPPGCDDLTVYLRHLAQADCMIDGLQRYLEGLPGPAGLCFFGDHVPIMAQVYEALGAPPGPTEYLIWNTPSGRGGPAPATTLRACALAERFLQCVGLAS